MSRSELEEQAKRIRYDLTAAQGKLSELIRALNSMPPDAEQEALPFHCDRCVGGQSFKTQARLEEHLINVHAVGSEEEPAPPPPALWSAPAPLPARRPLDEVLPAPTPSGD